MRIIQIEKPITWLTVLVLFKPHPYAVHLNVIIRLFIPLKFPIHIRVCIKYARHNHVHHGAFYIFFAIYLPASVNIENIRRITYNAVSRRNNYEFLRSLLIHSISSQFYFRICFPFSATPLHSIRFNATLATLLGIRFSIERYLFPSVGLPRSKLCVYINYVYSSVLQYARLLPVYGVNAD